MYFTYGEKELDFLRQKDKRLAEVIDRIGPVRRTVDTDLFSAVVHHIIGQQISTKAQATIWQRMCDALGTVHAKTVLGAGVVITGSTHIIDVTEAEPKQYKGYVPAGSVVIPGSYPKRFPAGEYGVPCALIIGRRKESTDKKTSLTAALRDFGVSV